MFFSSKAHFQLSGCVNQQNVPHEFHTQGFYIEINWCVISAVSFIVPYFIEDYNDASITITSACYVDILSLFFELDLNEHEDFQNDKI